MARGLGLVMGNVDGGKSVLLLEPADLDPDPFAQFGIQIGQRLVEEYYPRTHGQSAGQGDALLLTSREHGWILVYLSLKINLVGNGA